LSAEAFGEGGSHPDYFRGKTLDCFVARVPRNDDAETPCVFSSFRFAESAQFIIHLHGASRLLRCCACGMIAATPITKPPSETGDKGRSFP
jgi:hypothetical protein